jgi:flagellar basal-body rod protein FlgF
MDRLVYLSMSGAKALMERQDAIANNLANANTPGFRADLMAFRAVPVQAEGTSSTRVYNLEVTAGFDHKPGPVMQTGAPLDVAIRGQGWFVVQTPDGGEAYTRNGNFTLGPEGALQTAAGQQVMGDGGPLVIPANAEVVVGADGTVSARTGGQPPIQVGRLRLVNPPPEELVKGADGLIRTSGGDPAPADPAVRVAAGAVESSNVNVVEAMVGMIALARQFEYQMKLMQTTQTNDERAASLLSLNA